MKRLNTLFLIFLLPLFLFAQEGFQFNSNKNKITIPFQLVNNLIIISIEVNEVPLNFILDTGVEETILFSLEETDTISFSNFEKIIVKGYGKKESYEAFKTSNNKLNCKDFLDNKHIIYLVLDKNINFSTQMGVPINGFIGYHFFKNHPIKINYAAKKITIYKNPEKVLKKIEQKFTKLPLIFNNNKPYLFGNIEFENSKKINNAKLLIDTGNSDALWVLNKNDTLPIPQKRIYDLLGTGFSGEIFGFKAKIPQFQFLNYKFQQPIVAFPEYAELDEISKNEDRMGTIGSEILKRFTIIFDYKSQNMYLRKNGNFNEPFHFDMSGMEVQHTGLQWISESYENNPAIANNLLDSNGNSIKNNLQYRFVLKPKYIIFNIRKNSPAELVGIKKDDILMSINYKNATSLTLQEINEILKSEEGRTITIEVERKGVLLKFSFQLRSDL